MIYVIFIVFALISFAVQKTLQHKFEKYSKVPIPNGLTGKDIAERMLRENGITDVAVTSVEGKLTDHYNPETRSVNLSKEVYSSNSVAAAAVAAHECGHAVQHATAYSFLTMRSKMVPVVSFASNWVQWLLLGGIVVMSMNGSTSLLLGGIVLFALTTLFSFITLPVEINASVRATAWLSRAGITNVETHDKAVDALKWAAYTYVVAALSSLATLVYYVMIFMNRRDN